MALEESRRGTLPKSSAETCEARVVPQERRAKRSQGGSGWYEDRRSGLGSEFVDEFLRALDLIESDPEANPSVDDDVRRALLRRFPYGVYYSTEADHIQILAVLHLHRDPSSWRTRR